MSGASSLYGGAAFVTGLMAFLLFSLAVAEYLGYASAEVVGSFSPTDLGFLGVLSAVVAIACAAKASE